MSAAGGTTPHADDRSGWENDAELQSVITLLARHTAGLADSAAAPGTQRKIQDDGVGTNRGEHYVNDVFALRDFCWCDGQTHPEDADGIPACPPNFEHFASGIQGEWYKHLGRDVRFNRKPTAGEALAVLSDCLESLPIDNTPWPANSRANRVENPSTRDLSTNEKLRGFRQLRHLPHH